MDTDEITRTINSFPSWYYQFDLGGVSTPVASKITPIRVAERRKYFLETLVNLCGGSLKGRRVLDIACNAGFWSLQAIENGCDFVLGVDGRQMHIDQANFVFQAKGIGEHRYKFVRGNIFDVDLREFGTFDIVFCLGFFHHIGKHMELLEKIAQVNSDILLLETRVSRIPGAYMAIQYETTDLTVNSLDYSLTMVPTKRAVLGMLQQHGYTAAMLRPHSGLRSAEPDYRAGRRKAFLCSKETNLSNLPVAVERVNLRSELVDIAVLGAHLLRRPLRKLGIR